MPTGTLEQVKTKIQLRPLADRVVVERDEGEDRTAGGIVLPDNAKEKINRGRVVAIGAGKFFRETLVKHWRHHYALLSLLARFEQSMLLMISSRISLTCFETGSKEARPEFQSAFSATSILLSWETLTPS